jgi:hypothetical protein
MRVPYRTVYELVASSRLSDSTRTAVLELLGRLNAPGAIERAATGLLANGFPAAQVQVLTELSANVADPGNWRCYAGHARTHGLRAEPGTPRSWT